MSEPKTFTIGLTMAGAVSAGAYTAGVIDVLFRALDAHNALVGTDGGPRHKVAVKVMSGASAGGVCAGLATAALVDGNHGGHLSKRHSADEDADYAHDYVLKAVHDVWVDGLDLLHPSGEGFLSLDDLDHAPVRSVLNSRHIDEVAETALASVHWHEDAQSCDFLAGDLELFLTTTNLMGVPYPVAFAGSDEREAHVMAQHSIARHFRCSGLGRGGESSPWLEAWRDEGTPLPLPEPGGGIDFRDGAGPPGWAALKQTAIATGAFPLGLSPRVMHATVGHYGVGPSNNALPGGAWPIEEHPDPFGFPPAFHPRFGEADWEKAVPYVAVDGGVANNEPFEFARFTIRETFAERRTRRPDEAAAPSDDGSGRRRWLASNARGAEDADRAVIMIDPFPEGPEFTVPDLSGGEEKVLGMLANAGLLPGALKDQARFKPSLLLLARDDEVASRFLIAPSRAADGHVAASRGAAAIASGLLYGFGGFIDRRFRAHDFMLGQHNCASFLSRHFVLHPCNPVLGLPEAEQARLVEEMDKDPKLKGVPIVQVDALGRDFVQPPWPQVSRERLRLLRDALERRLRRVVKRLGEEQELGWLAWAGVGAAWMAKRPAIIGWIAGLALASLIERKQIEGFDGPLHQPLPDLDRIVFAALARRGRRPATPEELTSALNRARTDQARARGDADPDPIEAQSLREALGRLSAMGALWQVRDGGPYTVALNPPGRWSRGWKRLVSAGRAKGSGPRRGFGRDR